MNLEERAGFVKELKTGDQLCLTLTTGGPGSHTVSKTCTIPPATFSATGRTRTCFQSIVGQHMPRYGREYFDGLFTDFMLGASINSSRTANTSQLRVDC